ncbi:kinase-like domain-containing protein [Hypoxylon fragiforme]|uniref:kinase-like domain-containing protein n=1 Tax=Hypoxylon fragiforme TaxID=63214 RepID=UPI0020C5E89A|nr:kinase-like domain-containing protein [Hypoxylon fragiforme]KAI2608147.1 kinase-like domain-containing protein [Hypoxylon fragiforme]
MDEQSIECEAGCIDIEEFCGRLAESLLLCHSVEPPPDHIRKDYHPADECTCFKTEFTVHITSKSPGILFLMPNAIMKFQPAFPPSSQAASLSYLNERTRIPIPTVFHECIEHRHPFLVTSRTHGQDLRSAWSALSGDAKKRIAMQAAAHLSDMRSLTSDRIEAVGHLPLHERALFGAAGQKPLSSDDELWDRLRQPLASEDVDEDTLALLRGKMPRGTPYTFTHCDLTFSNIMVKDGSFAGFIDFERAGFFPVWYEYVMCRHGIDEEDVEWKKLLSGQMVDQHPKAMNWFLALKGLGVEPHGGETERWVKAVRDGSEECPVMMRDW